MQAAVHPQQEARLDALRSYDILDTPRESSFDEIVALASALCEAPISVVNLIDASRQWFKAEVGLGVRETPIDTSICAHAILSTDFVEIPDTQADLRMADNPLCLGDHSLRFYAGVLLRTEKGLPLGTLCVLDYKPRRLSALQRQALSVLGRQVMTQLDLRLALRRQKLLVKEIDHRVKNSLAAVSAVVRLQGRHAVDGEQKKFLAAIESRVERVGMLHGVLYQSGTGNEADLATYLGRLRDHLERIMPENVEVHLSAEPVICGFTKAQGIGVIVSEFVLNAAKHAFPGGQPGRVVITLGRGGDATLVLRCADNGVGLAAGASGGKGLGQKLIEAAVLQVGGASHQETTKGFALTVNIPLSELWR